MKKELTNQNRVKKGIFGVKYLYLDEKTRIRYGFSFPGIMYTLQRKKLFWRTKAWTYPSTHDGKPLSSIIDYLMWYEEYETDKCLF